MAEDAGTWGPGDGTTGGGPTGAGPAGESGGITPGQLRAERLARSHALTHLAEEVAAAGREAGACRGAGTWTGPAHDAFAAAVDDLAERITRAAGGLRAAADA